MTEAYATPDEKRCPMCGDADYTLCACEEDGRGAYTIPEGHAYHLTEEERAFMPNGPVCLWHPPSIVGVNVAARLCEIRRSLIRRRLLVFVPAAGRGAVYDITDNGRQALALYEALGEG